VALAFVVLQFVCQLALLVEALGPLRILIRTASFGISLALLALVPGRGAQHPAVRPLGWALALLGLSLLHPTTNSLLAGAAQIALYVAILAPLFWVPRLAFDSRLLRRLLLLLLAINVLSAGVGALQVYFPGRFQPALSSVIAQRGDYADSLQFTLASGERIFRPMGLTDIPGGAANAGFFAVLLGAGFLLASRRLLTQVLAAGCMFLGVFCIYLSQVRAVMVILVIALAVLAGLLAVGGQVRRLARLGVVVSACAVVGLGWAVSVGGETALRRWSALFADDASHVYYTNRGHFLEYTVTHLLPEFPLGAGLGRWGMINGYFGDDSDPESGPLFAEIQWTGWLFDGGVPLIVLYLLALLVALRWALRIALDPLARQGDLWVWASLIFAYNVGALALTFSYPLFIGQAGLEYWVLNAVLFHAFVGAHAARREGSPA
jgi:hypothetical protein